MNNLRSCVLSGGLALSLGLSGCRSFEYYSDRKIVDSVVRDGSFSFVSLDALVVDAGRFDGADARAQEISVYAKRSFEELRGLLLHDDEEVTHKVNSLVKSFDGYRHPFAQLLSNELQNFAYVTVEDVAVMENHIVSKTMSDNSMFFAFPVALFCLPFSAVSAALSEGEDYSLHYDSMFENPLYVLKEPVGKVKRTILHLPFSGVSFVEHEEVVPNE
ncbi:MAG: hypothetical protein Q7R96_01565 [Nanoarchaeota archaeon]|nr:hypothetical protein [Nanoarchaeota archaeon]